MYEHVTKLAPGVLAVEDTMGQYGALSVWKNDVGKRRLLKRAPGCVAASPAHSTKFVQRRAPVGAASRAHAALDRLKHVLKFMTTNERRCAIAGLPPRARTALLAFMEATAATNAPRARPKRKTDSGNDWNGQFGKGTGVRTIHGIKGTRYVAQLRLASLRFYTLGQSSVEVASRYCTIFARFRSAVDSAGDDIWDSPTKFCLLFENMVKHHNVCEQDMGLSVFIYMRADEWIDRAQAITSPTLSLADAVALHGRLFRARAESWDSLRREWAPLLRCTKARGRVLSLTESEEIAEQAHRRHLKKRLAVAVSRVSQAVACRDQEERRTAKKWVRERGQRMTDDGTGKRRTLQEVRQLRAEKQRWLRRRDLSVAEMMRGPPSASSDAGGT